MKMLSALGIGLVLVGCMNEDDMWWPDVSEGGGKADAVATVAGSSIPSAFVDPAKSYLADRQIGSLVDAGAFDALESGLATRADGIVANLPADGSLHVAELAKLETPELFASLFPAERAALPELWKRLEAPTAGGTLPGTSIGPFTVTDRSTPPLHLVVPTDLLISTLAPAVQPAARRVQLLRNSDGDPATISLADIDGTLANPNPFTPAELDLLRATRDVFALRAKSTGVATAEVTAPGDTTEERSLGPISVTIRTVVRYDERRVWTYQSSGASWSGSFRGTRTVATTLGLPDDGHLLLIDRATGAERVLEAGDLEETVPAGSYVLEVWADGERVFARDAVLPELPSLSDQLDLAPYFDHTLFATGAPGTPLVRNLVAARGGGSNWSAEYTFDQTSVPATTSTPTAITLTATPDPGVPDGRYIVDVPGAGPLTFDIYPGGAVTMILRDRAIRPMWQVFSPTNKGYGGSWLVANGPHNPIYYSASYICANQQLTIYRDNQFLVGVRLTPQMRQP